MISEEKRPVPAGPFFLAARLALDRLDCVSRFAVVAVMAAMTLIVSVQVLLRYAFGSSIDSADELARLFFVWAMFLAIPHGVRRGAHIGIEVVVNLLPLRHAEQIFKINSLLAAGLMLVAFLAALPVIAGKWDELMPTIEVTAAVYYIAVLFSAGHACLHLLLFAWGGRRCWEGFQTEEGEGGLA